MAPVKSKRARVRKQHVQQSLFRRGGKRPGAGRKPAGPRAGARHAARLDFKPTQPLHVVVRVVPEVGSLRRRSMYKAIRDASLTALMRERFRITHISVQRSHIHMLVEASDKAVLGSAPARSASTTYQAPVARRYAGSSPPQPAWTRAAPRRAAPRRADAMLDEHRHLRLIRLNAKNM